MQCVKFSETKAERKYYEGKKQKALRYIDQTRAELLKMVNTQSVLDINNRTKDKLENEIHNKLRDITSYVNDI